MQDCYSVTQSTRAHVQLLLDFVLQIRRHTPRTTASRWGYMRRTQNIAELRSQTIIVHCDNGLCEQTPVNCQISYEEPKGLQRRAPAPRTIG